MEASIMEAHQYVQREAPGSGTTVTAALVLGQQVTVAHVGDSRAYSVILMEGSSRSPVTIHWSSDWKNSDTSAKTKAANFPHRNVLIRALGQGEALEADIFTIPFPQSGYL